MREVTLDTMTRIAHRRISALLQDRGHMEATPSEVAEQLRKPSSERNRIGKLAGKLAARFLGV
jgi:hypothetical protein